MNPVRDIASQISYNATKEVYKAIDRDLNCRGLGIPRESIPLDQEIRGIYKKHLRVLDADFRNEMDKAFPKKVTVVTSLSDYLTAGSVLLLFIKFSMISCAIAAITLSIPVFKKYCP